MSGSDSDGESVGHEPLPNVESDDEAVDRTYSPEFDMPAPRPPPRRQKAYCALCDKAMVTRIGCGLKQVRYADEFEDSPPVHKHCVSAASHEDIARMFPTTPRRAAQEAIAGIAAQNRERERERFKVEEPKRRRRTRRQRMRRERQREWESTHRTPEPTTERSPSPEF